METNKQYLNAIYKLTHKEEEDKEFPTFCFVADVFSELSEDEDIERLEIQDVVNLALENGYKVIKIFPSETYVEEYIILAEGCPISEATDMYVKFYGVEPEYEELSNEELDEKLNKNYLKSLAKKHKKTDVKGAKGWFVNPNAGNVELNVAHFNSQFGGTAQADGGVGAVSSSGGSGMAEEFSFIRLEDITVKKIIDTLNKFSNYENFVYVDEDAIYAEESPLLISPNGDVIRMGYYSYTAKLVNALSKAILKNDELTEKYLFNKLGFIEIRYKKDKYSISRGKVVSDKQREILNTLNIKVQKNNEPEFTEESLEEDTIKVKDGKWTNKGKEGTHGTFKTKKQADAQRKAMFANGYREDLQEKVEKHNTLNPKLWNEDNTLKEEVRDKINEIVNDFLDDLKEDGISFKVKDIILVGSNCSYNYNDKSDLDIHIKLDTKSLKAPDNLYPLIYSAYRSLYNKKRDIDFYGIPVEIYVETLDDEIDDKVEESRKEEPLKSNGIYSVKNNEWIKEPVAEDIPELDQEAFDKEYNKWEDRFFEVRDSGDSDAITDYIEDIYEMRKESLKKDGEYGIGNLVFKEIRNFGYLDELKEIKNQTKSRELSLESLRESKEDSFIYNRKKCWCGSVNLLDGKIEEVHSYKEAEREDFHHSFYFSEPQVIKMDEGECAFFFVDGNDIQINPIGRESIDFDEREIINRIKEQIKLLK